MIRRRPRATASMVKLSFSLHPDVVSAIKRAVRDGRAESASAFVELAIRERLRWTRRQSLHNAYAEAARDPAFVEDVEETVRAFDATTADGLSKRRS